LKKKEEEMKEYTKKELVNALIHVGLKKKDIVLVSTELFTLGKLKGSKTKKEYCKNILDAIFEVIGRKEGTVVVNTFTTYTARYGVAFDYNNSRPTTGLFSEYVLSHPGSVRSLHPINSVAAIGKMKAEICLNVPASNYGLDSPFDRMYKLGCQILRLGVHFGDNALTHYIESSYGLPYLYNKLLDIDVIVDGRKINKQFFASVRHLELNLKENFASIKNELIKAKCVHSVSLGEGKIHRILAKDYCRVLLNLLKKDPYALWEKPVIFKKGEKPYDGITRGKDGVQEVGNFLFEDRNEQNNNLER
jgi:aminoglycoside N3'-acetyltransferase